MPRRKARKQLQISEKSLKAYAQHLIQVIREPPPKGLADKVFFTLDTLIHLGAVEFEQVARITRYQKTRLAVNYLIDHGELVKVAYNHLCLPEKVRFYERNIGESGLTDRYAKTVERLVSKMPIKTPFAVMDVVTQWRTDPQLTLDAKRIAVRNSLPKLARERYCTRLNEFQYVVGEAQ